EEVVAATGGELPEIATVRRVSGRDVVLILLMEFAAYLLLGQLADIGLSTIFDKLSGGGAACAGPCSDPAADRRRGHAGRRGPAAAVRPDHGAAIGGEVHQPHGA